MTNEELINEANKRNDKELLEWKINAIGKLQLKIKLIKKETVQNLIKLEDRIKEVSKIEEIPDGTKLYIEG